MYAMNRSPMKVRPILILLLLIGSVGVVGWMYYAVTRPAMKLHIRRDEAVLADLDRCCRRKHAKSVQYEHFARIADEEHRHATADLFRAMAHSERVQEQYCAGVIGKLGGRYTPPQRIILFRGATNGNVERSTRLESDAADSLHRAQIGAHLKAGNRLAARALIWAAANDLRHRLLLERCSAWEQHPPRYFAVCPACGNTYAASALDSFCPHCLTDGHRFIRFGER